MPLYGIDLSRSTGPQLTAALTRAMQYVEAIAAEIAARRKDRNEAHRARSRKARAAQLATQSPQQRKKIARAAAKARWRKAERERVQ